jgi:two-component system nitrate/nitrite response regulator NarL
MDTDSVSIAILDNHALVRAGLQLLLENHPGMKVVGDAGNLADSVEMIARTKPDIILFDLNLAEQSEVTIISELVKASETSRLILVTGSNEPAMIQLAVENGVMGVIFKSQPPDRLIKAIEKVNSGEVWLERSLIANVLSRLSRNHKPERSSYESNGIEILSVREKEIVRLIGQGLKNKSISTKLCISETTVRHHLTSIYGKLGVSDRLELLIFAHRNGLVKRPN